jgi:ABC-type branched-subunit amino acid transport system ATPase component
MRRHPRVAFVMGAAACVSAIEGIQGYGVSLLTPEFAATFAVGAAGVVSARVLSFLLGAAVSVVVPRMPIERRASVQTWSLRVSAILCALVVIWTGTVTSTAGLVGVLCLAAVVGAPSGGLHRGWVVERAPARFRVRALSAVQLAASLAQVAVGAAVAAGGLHVSRHAFEVTGLVVLGVALVASTLLRALPASGANMAVDPGERTSWRQITRAWRATPTVMGVGAAVFAIGALQLPFGAVFSIYLHQRWKLSTSSAGTVFLIVALASAAVVVLNASCCERLLNERPDRLAAQTCGGLLLGSVLLAVGVCVPNRVIMVALVALGAAFIAACIPLFGALGFAVVPPSHRLAMSAGLAATFSLGAAAGVAYATAFEDRHGPRSALVALAVVGAVVAGYARIKTEALPADQRRVRDEARDLELQVATVASGRHLPLLSCRGIDFSYGALQVLFEVDFVIDEGEVVALLGTNGAGKSTLLKVISGIELPQRGSVRLSGRDITYLDAEDRVRSGITQVPGGRSVFGSMSVIENLQTFGYTLGRRRRTVDAAIDRCVEAFPWISDRRTSAAATLSGGEQQMVGLCKALMLRPRLLLIDELSLGLAPVVIGPLLDLVREINSAGTAVVVVEQSVNIALSLVDHAYFMEKGSIRFNGRAKDLLDRQDLLRAVFLEGAAKTALS